MKDRRRGLTPMLAFAAILSSCAPGRVPLAAAAGLASGVAGAEASGAAARAVPPPSAAQRARAAALTPKDKAGQVLLVGVGGRGKAAAVSLELVEEIGPGGIMLFGFNIPEEASGLGPLVAEYQDAAARRGGASRGRTGGASTDSAAPGDSVAVRPIPLLVALDHEGGGVFRFKEGMTRVPAPRVAAKRGPEYVRLLGERAGLELRALGVNLVLAPVVEPAGEGNGPVLGTRSYGAEPALVDGLAGAYIEGLQAAGLAATAKHFPATADGDPHKVLASLPGSAAELEARYFGRFAAARARGVRAVLLSHVLVPAVDPKRPATVSRALVSGQLRGRLGFEGLVVTDDLLMAGLAGSMSPEEAAVEALLAGADLLMLSTGKEAPRVRDAILAALRSGRLPESRLDEAVARLLALKESLGLEAAFDASERARRLEALPGLVEESERLLGKQD